MARPTLFIVDSAVDLTGALVSAGRQAELLAEDVETVLILPRGHQVPSVRTTAFAEVIELPIVNLRRSVGSLIGYLPALVAASVMLRREMSRRGCERLQLNDFYLPHGAVVRLLGFRGRIVTWVRIDPKRYGIVGRIWLALARWSSNELIAVSKFIGRQLPPSYRSTLFYDSVAIVADECRAASQKLLFVGNYIEGKGQDSAIRAFHLIAERYSEAELVFHGSTMETPKNRDYLDRLSQLAAAGPGKGRIYLGGFVQNPTIAFQEAFAAVNFSHSESFSLTCLEASAHGLPIVATRCGGPEEIIDEGATGYLVPVGDVDAMAGRMADLLDDPKKAASMGEAGRRLVNDRFGAAQFRREVMEIFDLD